MPEGKTVAQVAGTVLQGISTANVALGAVVQALVLYRQLRQQAAGTSQAGDYLDDSQLIGLLKQDSQALVDRANQLLTKYAPGT